MVMKVGINYPIMFKSVQTVSKSDVEAVKEQQNAKAPSVVPSRSTVSSADCLNVSYSDYNVTAPQKYTKLGVHKMDNGLEIHSYKLANGHRVTIVPMEGSPSVVKNYVNVGSLNETDDIKGISHFLEHMAFNGTNGENGYTKLNVGDSFKKIENIGGWTNASTSYSKTDYVNSAPLLEDEDLETQIKVLAAMTEDLKLSDEMIEKEKGPVCSEINMIMDNVYSIVYDQSTRTLFNIKSSADDLIGGSVEHIKNLTKEDVKAYYDKHYTPENMNLVITGDVNPDEVISLVSKNFKSTKKSHGPVYQEKLVPITQTVRKDFSVNKTKSAEIVVSFAGPKSNSTKEKIINTLLSEYFSSSECGFYDQMEDMNASLGYSLEKISSNSHNPVMLAFDSSCSEENSEKALQTMLKRIATLQAPKDKTLENIKKKMKKNNSYALENSMSVNALIGNSILNNNFDYVTDYNRILDEITPADIQNYIDKYLDVSKAAIIVLHPETTAEKLKENYAKVNDVSFKGRARQPLNMDKVSSATLDNNYEASFVKVKNNNIVYSVDLNYDASKLNINPMARIVLDLMLQRGTMDMNKEALAAYEEDNNIFLSNSLSVNCLSSYGTCDKESLPLAIKNLNNKLKNPRLTQEEFDICLNQIKDRYDRLEIDSQILFENYRAKYNPNVLGIDTCREAIETVTLDDVKKLHEYIMANSSGTISMSIPETMPEVKNVAIKELNKFDKVQPYEYKFKEVFVPHSAPELLVQAKETAQADVMQTYRYQREDNLKFRATERLLNAILNGSQEIGLFNTLREKEHLAYAVHAAIDRYGDEGVLACNILTTTDNKEIGEFSYDNVQKSINGFHRQIQALKDSKYSDEDLETAKRTVKASFLEFESSDNKVGALATSIGTKEGLDYFNEYFKIIDSITREDIDALAQKIFSKPPIYSIVASQDTLDANKEYLENLKKV